MRYWKGLLIAAVFDTALLGGRLILADRPSALPIADALAWPVLVPVWHEPDSLSLDQIGDIDRVVDSLMMHLQADSLDVGAMRDLALLYAEHGFHEAAIGPLARALEIDPGNNKLEKALDEVLEVAGVIDATAEWLAEKAKQFVEAVEMWGEGC